MKNILVILLIFTLASCERAVDIDLNDVESKLVVEATIENNQAPVVLLSKSLGFFSQIDPVALSGSFVHDAEVYISNGTLTHKLKEYTVPVGAGYSLYYFSIDSSNLGTAFTGELNKNYSLRIVWAGEEYTATTRIPLITKRIDSMYWKQSPPNNPPEKVMVMVKATDPPDFGDYVRYFTRRNSEQQFLPALNSVFDDQVIDGTTYDVQAERGIDRNRSVEEGYSFFNKGDTVTLKLSNIDKTTYDFWRTMEFTYTTVGNPFSSPTRVLSNISNGGLGYFGGYASQYKTIIIPR